MKSLLVINASGRVTRSITRQLTGRFVEAWRAAHPGAEIIDRDVGIHPPTPVSEAWIAASFTPADQRSPEMHEALEESETFIGEILRADAIVLGVPMYNFGMPAQMKAWFDQIVRVGRTFEFKDDVSDPYLSLLPSKPVVLITATGTSGYEPGGPNERFNFLDPHLQSVLAFVGLGDISLIRVGFEESQDKRFRRSVEAAEASLDEVFEKLVPSLVSMA
jgi:FMN-dependent NADH-azoreductase